MIKTMRTHKAKNIKAKNIIAVTAVFFLTFPSSAMALCIKADAVVNTAAEPCLMTLLSSGNIGIGIQTPPAQLSLGAPGHAPLSGAGNPYGVYLYRDTGMGVGYLDVLSAGANNTGLHLRTYGAGTYNTVLYGQSTGRVGIGNTNPLYTLDVTGSIAGTNVNAQFYNSTADNVEVVSGQYDPKKPIYRFSEQRGWGYNSADDAVYYAANEASPFVVRADGRVGIGTTSPSGALHITNTRNEAKLILGGYGNGRGVGIQFYPTLDSSAAPMQFFNAAGTSVGSVLTSASNTTYNTTSDYRLKENITPVSAALERVSALKPSHYNFKNAPNHPMDGFIAHELQTIAPYAVSGDKDAIDAQGNPIYQQVDYGKLTPLLAAAIQELAAEVEALRAEIKALKTAP